MLRTSPAPRPYGRDPISASSAARACTHNEDATQHTRFPSEDCVQVTAERGATLSSSVCARASALAVELCTTSPLLGIAVVPRSGSIAPAPAPAPPPVPERTPYPYPADTCWSAAARDAL